MIRGGTVEKGDVLYAVGDTVRVIPPKGMFGFLRHGTRHAFADQVGVVLECTQGRNGDPFYLVEFPAGDVELLAFFFPNELESVQS